MKSLNCSDVHDWSVGDVFEWLTSAQLDEYFTSFRVNEINGLLLVDITLDDLDYLGVTKLGHRKIILRSIEDLRKNGRITHHLIAANEGDRESKVSGSNATSMNVDALTAKKEAVHWSHLEPLSLHQVLAGIELLCFNLSQISIFIVIDRYIGLEVRLQPNLNHHNYLKFTT